MKGTPGWMFWCALLPALGLALVSCGDDDDDSGGMSADDYVSADNDMDDDADDDGNDDVGDDDTPVKARIAVVSDLHIWYPETDLGDETATPTYPALLAHEALQYIRNEGPVISRAVILDAISRGATHIVLNGDFSDSVERAVYEAFTEDLKGYEQQYGVRFLFVRGNHDAVTNANHETGEPHTSPLFGGMMLSNSRNYSIGALELFDLFEPFGLSTTDVDGSPENYIFWEYGPQTENGCGTVESDEDCATQTQFSYLVEPVENLWFLVIDTNGFSINGGGSGWDGDSLKTAKPRTWAWIADVYARAAERHKTVVAFGHHNLGDPFCGLTFDRLGFLEGALFDTRASATELAGLGMNLYVSGHLHMDYVSEYVTDDVRIIDVQTPSLTNYPVGYRLFTFLDDTTLDVETIVVRDVPEWDRYLGDYQGFAEQNDYSFEEYGVQNSATFDEYVDRSFEHMISAKIVGAVGDGVIPLLKLIRLYDLLMLAGLEKNTERVWIDDGGLRYSAGDSVERAARNALDDRIENAGLTVDEFKRLNIYDMAYATVRIQFGAKLAVRQMEDDGSLAYFQFFVTTMQGRSLGWAADRASSRGDRSLVSTLFAVLGSLLDDYWWHRPYMGKVRIDLTTNAIQELE